MTTQGVPGARFGEPQPSVGVLTRLRGLVLATHLGPTVVVTGLAAALSVATGTSPGRTALVTAAVLTGQLSIGWSNDWVDAERDLRVGRTDKPVVQGAVTAGGLRAAAFVAASASVVLSLAVGPLPGAVHLLVVAGGWAYNLGLKATAWSWLPYAVAFGALPAFVVLASSDAARPATWVVVVGALLGVGAHVANVLPDLEDDHETGIRGLPHRLGRRVSSVVAPAVLAVAAVVALVGPGQSSAPGVVTTALAVGGGAVAGAVGLVRPRSRLPFTLTLVVAVLCVAVVVLAGGDAAVA